MFSPPGIAGKLYEPSRVTNKLGNIDRQRLRKIGKGGYGKVYYVRPGLALKKIGYDGKTLDDLQTVFAEIAFLKRCNYDAIVGIIDAGYSFFAGRNMLALTLPLALGDASKLRDSLTLEQKKIVTYDLVRAVAYLHSRDILHRDIKPLNILVFVNDNREIRGKLADFGLALQVGCGIVGDAQLGVHAYTLYYRPPEILIESGRNESHYDYSADVWAIGMSIYEMFHGTPPALITDSFSTMLPPNVSDNSIGWLSALFKLLPFQDAPKSLRRRWKSFGLPKPLRTEFPRRWHSIVTAEPRNEIAEFLSHTLDLDPARRLNVHNLLTLSLFETVRTPEKEPESPGCPFGPLTREWYPAPRLTGEDLLYYEEKRKESFATFHDVLISAPRVFFHATLLYDVIPIDKETSFDHAYNVIALASVWGGRQTGIVKPVSIGKVIDYAEFIDFDLIHGLIYDIAMDKDIRFNTKRGEALLLSLFDTIRFERLPSQILADIIVGNYAPTPDFTLKILTSRLKNIKRFDR